MKIHYHLYTLTVILLSFILFPATGNAQSAASAATDLPSVFEYITKVDAIKITLEADMTTIIENKKTNTYFPGTLIMPDGKVFKVELKPRGKYRRKVADIPPLKIKFSKKALRADGLDSLNEIKLVLPCHDDAANDELVIKEYLAYRMFEHISPNNSIRARLIRLTIRDSHVEKSKKTMYAILVEDEEETEARIKGKLVEEYGIMADSLHSNQAAMVSVFEYMIGNTDWDISMIRNVRMIRTEDKITVLPYDFDFSGLVSAPYASPSSESGLKTVRDRFMMAPGIKPEALKRAAASIKSMRKDLYDICYSKYLPRDTSAQMVAYLETFFERINDQGELPQMLKMPMTD